MAVQQQSSTDANQQNTESNYSGQPIEGTPFHKVSNGETAFVAMGNMRMTKPVAEEEFNDYYEKNKVNIIADMVIVIVDRMLNKQENK